MPKQGLKITALSTDQASQLLTAAYRREISSGEVAKAVERFGLLRPDGCFSLLDYVAALVEDAGRG